MQRVPRFVPTWLQCRTQWQLPTPMATCASFWSGGCRLERRIASTIEQNDQASSAGPRIGSIIQTVYNPLGWNLNFLYPSLKKIIKNILKLMKQGLENSREIIPDTFGKPFDSGNLIVGYFSTILMLFLEKLDLKKTTFRDWFQTIPIIRYV